MIKIANLEGRNLRVILVDDDKITAQMILDELDFKNPYTKFFQGEKNGK